jgi:hypothetical protein
VKFKHDLNDKIATLQRALLEMEDKLVTLDGAYEDATQVRRSSSRFVSSGIRRCDCRKRGSLGSRGVEAYAGQPCRGSVARTARY